MGLPNRIAACENAQSDLPFHQYYNTFLKPRKRKTRSDSRRKVFNHFFLLFTVISCKSWKTDIVLLMKWRTISVWTPSLPAMRTQRHLLFCFYSQIKMTPIFSAFFLCFYYYYSPDVCFSFSFFKVSLAHFLYYLLQFTTVYSGGSSFPVSNTTWKKKSTIPVEFSTRFTTI